MGTMQRGKRRQSSARRPPTGYTQAYTLLYSLPSTLVLILFLLEPNSLFLERIRESIHLSLLLYQFPSHQHSCSSDGLG